MPRPHRTQRYQQFLERLRAARRAAKLRQVEVAQAFGSTQTFISKCERGARLVNALDLFDFAQLYGVPMSSLVPARLEEPGAIPHITPDRHRRVAEPRIRPGAGEQETAKESAGEPDTSGKAAGAKGMSKTGAGKQHRSKSGARQRGATKKSAGRKDAGTGRGKMDLAKASSRKSGSKSAGSRKLQRRATDKKGPRKRKRPPEGSK